jgi:hypothetical protein
MMCVNVNVVVLITMKFVLLSEMNCPDLVFWGGIITIVLVRSSENMKRYCMIVRDLDG